MKMLILVVAMVLAELQCIWKSCLKMEYVVISSSRLTIVLEDQRKSKKQMDDGGAWTLFQTYRKTVASSNLPELYHAFPRLL